MAKTKPVRERSSIKVQISSRTELATLIKLCGAIRNIVFGIVLQSLGLLCRAGDYVSEVDCAALRAMTGPEGESAAM